MFWGAIGRKTGGSTPLSKCGAGFLLIAPYAS